MLKGLSLSIACGLAFFLSIAPAVAADGPTADAGPDQTIYADFPVQLDGSASTGGSGSITAYQWSQVLSSGDPMVALSDSTIVDPTFFAPNVPLGGRTLVFQLTVTNSLGLSSVAMVHITVGNEADPKSVFYYESDPGNAVGQGSSGLALPDNATIELGPSPADHPLFEITPTIDGIGFSGAWDLKFSNEDSDASTQPIKKGVYFATGAVGAPAIAMNEFINNGTLVCTFPTGMFIVRDVAFAEKTPPELGVDFVVHCDGDTGVMRGSVRLNSTTAILVNEPTAYAGPDQTLDEPSTVTLDGSDSFLGWTPATYQWKQVGGPRLTLTNANTVTASFDLPEKLLANGGNALVFQLTVKNSLGLSSTSNVTITAKESPYITLDVQSDAGDPIGGGQTAAYGFAPASVKLQSQAKLSASAVLSGNGGWTLDFVGPIKRGLEVGTYSNATLFQRSPGNTPLMNVSTIAAQCKTVTGSFTVLDVLYGMGNKIDSLAVDFVQHCNGIGPALHGKFRYHSAVP